MSSSTSTSSTNRHHPSSLTFGSGPRGSTGGLARLPLERTERASSPSLTSPRPGRSLLTLNMNMRKISRQPAPHLQLTTTTEEMEPASSIPFTPASVSPLYPGTPITRPRLTWSEERALRESLETAFTGLNLRAQSFVEEAGAHGQEDAPPPPPEDTSFAIARRSRSRSHTAASRGRLEVEEHARGGRGWLDEGRREAAGAGRGRPRRGSTASARGRGTAMKSLRAPTSSAVDSSRQ